MARHEFKLLFLILIVFCALNLVSSTLQCIFCESDYHGDSCRTNPKQKRFMHWCNRTEHDDPKFKETVEVLDKFGDPNDPYFHKFCMTLLRFNNSIPPSERRFERHCWYESCKDYGRKYKLEYCSDCNTDFCNDKPYFFKNERRKTAIANKKARQPVAPAKETTTATPSGSELITTAKIELLTLVLGLSVYILFSPLE